MLPEPKNIKRFRHLDSTFSAARDWIDQNYPVEGSVVLADYQTNGKGTGSNSWESESGKNILLSMILYPEFLSAEKQFRLNQVFSLAVHATVKFFLPDNEIVVKWPNDVLVEKKKIAGLLFQNTVTTGKISSCVAGLGLNVNQITFPVFSPSATSLKSISGIDHNRQLVLGRLLQNIYNYYDALRSSSHDEIHSEYISSLLNYGTEAAYRSGEKIFSGTITGITAFGQLEIMVDGVRKIYNMKEIEFIIN